MTAWRVDRLDRVNNLDLPVADVRTVRLHEIDRSTLVLGSRQTIDVVDRAAAAAAGVRVVVRRSGGGAVLLEPGTTLWVDVFVPRGDPLWDDDVGRAAWWLGAAWASAIGNDAHVHRGGLSTRPETHGTRWSDLVCFAGVGPGEVTAGDGGPKLVGISQRRTKAGAWFQCAAMARWEPVGILALLDLPAAERVAAAQALAGVATGLPIPLGEAEAQVVDALP